MKRIAFLVPDFGSGKTARSIRSQGNARALVRRGYEVSVLTASTDSDNTLPEVSTLRTWSRHPSNESGFVWRLWGELVFGIEAGVRLAFGRFDHVIITTPPFISMLCVVMFLRMRRRQYSLDVRDLYPDVYVLAGLVGQKNLGYRVTQRLTNRMYRHATVLVGATETLSNTLAARAGRREVPVVMNGYLDELFFPAESNVPRFRDGCTLVCHGNFGALFDVESFEVIARKLAVTDLNYRILLIGFGAKLQRLKDLALPNVVVMDAMPHAEVAKIVRESDIGLSIHHPYEEAFPVKVLEYIGAGLPAVVIPQNEGARVIGAGKFGYAFDSEDLDKAVDVLRDLIASRTQRDEISRHIRKERVRFSRATQSEIFADTISLAIQAVPDVDSLSL